MICELCKTEKDIETLTLCKSCFDKVNNHLEFLIVENQFLKIILKVFLDKSGETKK